MEPTLFHSQRWVQALRKPRCTCVLMIFEGSAIGLALHLSMLIGLRCVAAPSKKKNPRLCLQWQPFVCLRRPSSGNKWKHTDQHFPTKCGGSKPGSLWWQYDIHQLWTVEFQHCRCTLAAPSACTMCTYQFISICI